MSLMSTQFEFATATRILFGEGKRKELAPAVAAFGKRCLIVTGANSGRAAFLAEGLKSRGVGCHFFTVAAEPSIHRVEEGRLMAAEFQAEAIVSIGGGSAIDCGKAIAILATNGGELLDYLEVIGRAKAFEKPPLPFAAVPTTAGTGTEVTRNAVLSSPEHRVKVSLRSPLMLPRLAVIDPELTYGLPPELTASTGMDALTQLIEPFLSIRANPMTDAICREGLAKVTQALHRVVQNPGDHSARKVMSLCSFFGGLALANAGLGAVHGFAAAIGGMFAASHGAVCAALLLPVLEANHAALTEREPRNPVLQRFDELGRLFGEDGNFTFHHATEVLRSLSGASRIPGLSQWGISARDIPEICAKAKAASSMKANPIILTEGELAKVLDGSI